MKGSLIYHTQLHTLGGESELLRKEEEEMASNAAVPFWRSAGMTYITYSNLCASLVRQCLKEPYRSESIAREKVHFNAAKWVDGKPEKPIIRTDSPE